MPEMPRRLFLTRVLQVPIGIWAADQLVSCATTGVVTAEALVDGVASIPPGANVYHDFEREVYFWRWDPDA